MVNKVVFCVLVVAFICSTRAEVDSAHVDDAANTIALINHINYVVETIRTYNNVVVLEQEYKTLSSDNLNLEKIPDEDVLRLINQILDALHGMRMDERLRKRLVRVLERSQDAAKLEGWLNFAQTATGILSEHNSGSGEAVVDVAKAAVQGGEVGAAVETAKQGVKMIGNILKTGVRLATAGAMEYGNYKKRSKQFEYAWEDGAFELDTKKLNDLAVLNKELINAEWGLIKKYQLNDNLRVTGDNVRQLAFCLKNPIRKRAYRMLLPMQKVFAVYPTYWYYRTLLALENDALDDALHSAETFRKVNRSLFRKDSMAAGVAMAEISAMLSLGRIDQDVVRKDLELICDQNYDSSNADFGIFAAMVYYRVLGDSESALNVLEPVAYFVESKLDGDLMEYCDLYKKPNRTEDLQEPNSIDLTMCRMLRFEIDKSRRDQVNLSKLKEICKRETTSSIEKLFYFGQVRVDDLWRLASHDVKSINMRVEADKDGKHGIVVEIPVRWFLLGDMPISLSLVTDNGATSELNESGPREHVQASASWPDLHEEGICVKLSFRPGGDGYKDVKSVILKLKHVSWPIDVRFEPDANIKAGKTGRFVQVETSCFLGKDKTKSLATEDEINMIKGSCGLSRSEVEEAESLARRGAQCLKSLELKDEDGYSVELADEIMVLCFKLACHEKNDRKREEYLALASGLANRLLWKLDQPVYFGNAVLIGAQVEKLRGNVDKAVSVIDEWIPNLRDIHDQVVNADPDGTKGLLRLSPLPECLFLRAEMLWDEAQSEFSKSGRDDDRIKDLLLGPKDKNGKRQGAKGALGYSGSVFLKFGKSACAPAAGELVMKIQTFAEKEYGAIFKTKITAGQIARAHAQIGDEQMAYDITRRNINLEFVRNLVVAAEMTQMGRDVERLAKDFERFAKEGRLDDVAKVMQEAQSKAILLMENTKDETVLAIMFEQAIEWVEVRRECYAGRKPKWQCDALDLERAGVLYKRMLAEERLGLAKEASKTCTRTYSTYVVFLEAHGPDKNHPLEKMDDGERLNLEDCYRQMVSILETKTGRSCIEREKIISYGKEYLSYFPAGKYRKEIARIVSGQR